MDKLSHDGYMLAKWNIESLSLEMALNDLHRAGIIETTPAKLIEKINWLIETGRHEDRLGVHYTMSHPYSLYRALGNTKIDIRINVKSEHKAFCHEMLIGTLSQDVFDPFSPSHAVQFHLSDSSQTEKRTNILQFIYEKRLFRTELQNTNNGYDIESVVDLINFSLEQTGKSKRFIKIKHDKSFVHFIFANPGKFIPIAEKYGIPIDEQFNLHFANTE